MRKILLLVARLFTVTAGFAQTPQADFSFPETVCKRENVFLQNNSSNASDYQWDFCEGDLQFLPSANPLVVEEFDIPVGVSLIKTKGEWYGFITSLSNNSIFRIDFGPSLSNPSPVVTNLGNIGSLVDRPQDIKAIEFADEYYLFVNNRGNNQLIRIDLGTDIKAILASSDVIVTGNGFTNGGIDVAFDGTQWVAFLTRETSLIRIVIGTNINRVPNPLDIQALPAIPESDNIGDIKIVEENGQWYGFVVGFRSKTFHRLVFGNDLSQSPSVVRLNVSLSGVSPYGISLAKDDNQWMLFSSTNEGGFLRLNIGEEITNNDPIYTNLGNLGQLRNALKFDMAKSDSRWVGLTTAWNTNKYFLISFPQSNCSFSQVYSSDTDNVKLTTQKTGMSSISLEAYGANGLISSVTKTITTTDTEAPILTISNDACFQSNLLQFSTQANQPLTSTTWTINNETLTGETVTYKFPTPGTYEVTLEVESENGCGNRLTKEITIYEPPVPNFIAPPGQVCTNGTVSFTNTTDTKGADALITYQRLVDDELVSEEANPAITFAEGGTQTVRLEAGIPGCTETVEQTVDVLQGPIVNFNVAQVCQGDPIAFENLTNGEGITGYAWDFGDGGSFSSVTPESPTYTFTEAGTFTVALTVANALGCENTYQQSVTVYEQPRVGFLSEIACVGAPTQFTDTTTAGTNANVIQWEWDFGDGQGTADVRNPTYAYPQPGTYEVKLVTQTTAGCVDSAFQSVTVESPVAAGFSSAPMCSDNDTPYTLQLIDTSTVAAGDRIDRWFWTVNGESFVSSSVTYAFPGPGDYEVSLTAFAASGCNATTVRTVRVDSLPELRFAAPEGCAGEPLAFRSQVTAPGREVIGYAWNFTGPDGERVGTAFEANPDFTFSEPGTYEVTLTVETADACTFATNQPVTVLASPVASFTASPAFGGFPLEVAVENTTTDATQYTWDFGGLATSAEENPTFTFTEAGIYVVTLTATNASGCSSTTEQTVEVVAPTEDLRLEEIVVSESASGAQQVLLSVSNQGTRVASDIAITIDLDEVVRLQEKMSQPVLPGQTVVYPLRSQLPAGIRNQRRPIRYLCVGLEAGDATFEDDRPENNRNCLSLNEALNVEAPFPNPAREELQLSVILPEPDVVAWQMMNQEGKILRRYQQETTVEGLNTFRLNVKGMPAGAYLLRLTYQGEQRQFRVSVAP